MKKFLFLGIPGLLITAAFAGGQNFDRLPEAEKPIFQKRFEKEIWPLMTRNGKNGCVGCHSGKIVSALELTGDVKKDFPYLLKQGFFLHPDPGSLLGRITDKDNERRMPPGKRPRWTEEEIKVLREFLVDLDKKQRK